MALTSRQERLYTDQVTIYRFTENLTSGVPGAYTWTAIGTAVYCYLQTGQSVKSAAGGFVLDEQDNLFSLDIGHFEADEDLQTGDVIYVTAGPETGRYFNVRGDNQIRNRHANKLSIRMSRLDAAPEGIA